MPRQVTDRFEDAGPLPENFRPDQARIALHEFGERAAIALNNAFAWHTSAQGSSYWGARHAALVSGGDLTARARRVLETWLELAGSTAEPGADVFVPQSFNRFCAMEVLRHSLPSRHRGYFLKESFSWVDTAQGHEFWSREYESLCLANGSGELSDEAARTLHAMITAHVERNPIPGIEITELPAGFSGAHARAFLDSTHPDPMMRNLRFAFESYALTPFGADYLERYSRYLNEAYGMGLTQANIPEALRAYMTQLIEFERAQINALVSEAPAWRELYRGFYDSPPEVRWAHGAGYEGMRRTFRLALDSMIRGEIETLRPVEPTPFVRQLRAYRRAVAALDAARHPRRRLHDVQHLLNDVDRAISGLFSDYDFFESYGKLRGVEIERCTTCDSPMVADLMLYDDDAGMRSCPRDVTHYYNVDWMGRTFEYNEPYRDEYDDDDDDDESGFGLCSYTANPIAHAGVSHVGAPGEAVPPKARLFGLEIEFVAPPNKLKRLISTARNDLHSDRLAVFKSDGSLPYGGAELCTVPFTRRGLASLEPLLNHVVEHGGRAWNRASCGLHVHVSRDSASWNSWGKVDRFFTNEANQEFIDAIAGREQNSFCARNVTPKQPHNTALTKFRRGMDRYAALNFSTGKPTVEFRLFRGNVRYDGVVRAVQFCDSIIEFASSQPADSDMTHESYAAWLSKRSKAYPQCASTVRKVMRDPGYSLVHSNDEASAA